MNAHMQEKMDKYVWLDDEIICSIYRYPNRTMLTVGNNSYDRFTGVGMDVIDENIDIIINNMDKKLKDYFKEDMIPDLEFFEFKKWIRYEDEPQKDNKLKIFGDRVNNFASHLALELTDKCNLACKHCYRDAGVTGDFMPKEKLFHAIDRAIEQGLSIIELTGGEVTLHPDFCEIVDYVSARLEVVAILTNGYYYNEEIINCLLRNKEHLLVNISIDSSYSEYHDSFRGKKGAWEKSCNLIRILADNGILVRVAMSVTPQNMFDVENTVKMVKEWGVKSFAFETVSGFGRGSEIDWSTVQPEDMRKYMKVANYINRKYLDMLTLVPAKMCRMMNNREINCGAGWRTFAVNPKGEKRFCVNTPTNMLSLGNFFEEEDAKTTELISKAAKIPVPTFHQCNKCERYVYCQGCLLKGVIASNNFDECVWEGKVLNSDCNITTSPYEYTCKKTILG